MPGLLVFLAILIAVLLVVWLVRSRGNTAGGHIDMTVTALGAATEAVEDAVEAVVHKMEDALAAGVKASGAKADDVDAQIRASATVMASAGAASGATVEIGIPAAVGAPDDLRRMKGVGPKLHAVLTGLGITRFDQIAAWSEADIAKVDAHLGTFKGRIARDRWVEQARFLASGDLAGFEAAFGTS